jgi:hypothetical protein
VGGPRQDVVDVLDRDQVAAGGREIGEQRAVPGRAQDEPPLAGARGPPPLVERERVGGTRLLREGDLEPGARAQPLPRRLERRGEAVGGLGWIVKWKRAQPARSAR